MFYRKKNPKDFTKRFTKRKKEEKGTCRRIAHTTI